MFAIVEAEMSTKLSAPRCSRSGDSGALVSENGTDAASLMRTPRWRSESAFADALYLLIRSQARSLVSLPESSHSRNARRVWQALSGSRENTESDKQRARLNPEGGAA